MTFDEARVAVATCLRAFKIKDGGLSDDGFAAISIAALPIYFEYSASTQKLTCSALVYRFDEPPKQAILDKLYAFDERTPRNVHGRLEYRPLNRALLVARSYTSTPAPAELFEDIKNLAILGSNWQLSGMRQALSSPHS